MKSETDVLTKDRFSGSMSASWEPNPIIRTLIRYTPRQGWDIFLLLLMVLTTIAITVRRGDWVETPGIFSIVFYSCLVGLGISKIKAPSIVLFPTGIAIGILYVAWQGSRIINENNFIDSYVELWNRLALWTEAVSTDQISTDLLPFTLSVIFISWMLGYLSSWFLFRKTNIWIGLILTGTALLTILSFLPDNLSVEFLVFLILAMLIITQITRLNQLQQWDRNGIAYSATSRWMNREITLMLIIPVLLLGVILPYDVMVSNTAIKVWDFGRTPVTTLENEFGRLFSGIPSRKDQMGRFFGTALPFQGKISFEGEIVFWATSKAPAYWVSRTYNEYTSQGWRSGDTKKNRVGPNSPPPPQTSAKRVLVDHQINYTFDTNKMLSGGNIDWINRDVIVETLNPLQFEIDVMNPSKDSQLPKDVQYLAQELRNALNNSDGFVQSTISKLLPEDMSLIKMYPDDVQRGTNLRRIKIARKDPIISDVISWEFSNRLQADEYYNMRTFISDASANDLRESGTEYSGFIKDHYLQLPNTLPPRVRGLAESLTQKAETPYDKALAIESFMRGPSFTYSQDIDKPPFGSDGVDHFLFVTKTGYSDYFASAMAVMLRSVGVPTRMVGGYAPGEQSTEEGVRQVKDSDSHGWVQVYFPSHGWIEFEPTTAWSAPSRKDSNRSDNYDVNNMSQSPAPECDEQGINQSQLFLDECPDTIDEESDSSILSESSRNKIFDSSTLITSFVTMIVFFIGAIVIIRLMWERGLRNVSPPAVLYIKMNRLATLAGLGRRQGQTPMEYARIVGYGIPKIADDVLTLATAYSANCYGNLAHIDEETKALEEVWRKVKSGLLARLVRRFIPF